VPEYFFFPLGLTYLGFGLFRFAILALAEKPDAAAVTLVPGDADRQENLQ